MLQSGIIIQESLWIPLFIDSIVVEFSMQDLSDLWRSTAKLVRCFLFILQTSWDAEVISIPVEPSFIKINL